MKNEGFIYIAAAVLASASILTPARTQTRHNLSLNFPESAERCADLKVQSSGAIAQAAENFTLSKSEAAVLEVNAEERGNIRVRGWDRPDYSVEACKIAVANDQAAADQALKSITVTRSAARISAAGPASSDNQWNVVFIVHAPSGASLDLQAKNGPIGVRDVNGTVKARVTNGPVSIDNCSGTVEAHAKNGPISFAGNGGDVHLNTENGPISLKISADAWNGQQLEARTVNGPLHAAVPNTFRSGVRVESSGHGPMSCSVDACRGAHTETTENRRVLELNGSSATVRLSTGNGPISVGAPRDGHKVI